MKKIMIDNRNGKIIAFALVAILLLIGTVGLASAAAAIGYVGKSGLVAHYPFNGNANDESGNGNHLESPSGRSPTLTTDRYNIANQAYNFNNAGSTKGQYFFKHAGNKDLGFPENEGSFSAWIYPVENLDDGFIIFYRSTGDWSSSTSESGDDRWGFKGDVDSIDIGVWSVGRGTNLEASHTFKTNQWYFVTFTWNSSGRRIYVDGLLVGQDSLNVINDGGDAYDWFIGKDPWSIYKNSPKATIKIDEIRIYNRALSDGEILELYGGDVPTPKKGLWGGHSYLVVTEEMTWDEAKRYAESLGGHLVTISDGGENTFVADLAREKGVPKTFWIGLTDEVQEGDFVWVTSEPLSYTNWHSGEPNNAGNEDYVQIGWHSKYSWNDGRGYETNPFVVEFEGIPTPATVTNCIYFNTGAWTNISSVFINGTEIYGGTNNKYSGTAYMYLWLSFDSPQTNISLRHCPDDIDPQTGEPNWGDRAGLAIEEISSTELRSRLTADFVPYELRAGLKGPYIYRIIVTAPDHGYHSSYIFSFDTPPNNAIGWGNVDAYDWLARVRVCNLG